MATTERWLFLYHISFTHIDKESQCQANILIVYIRHYQDVSIGKIPADAPAQYISFI